jgi:hypothetical protein
MRIPSLAASLVSLAAVVRVAPGDDGEVLAIRLRRAG